MKNIIDKLAWIQIDGSRVLVTRSKGKDKWYIPGGKREEGESDRQALVREVREELGVALDPTSIQFYGTFEAPAHGKPEGVMVKMTCYTAQFEGTLTASAEVAEYAYFGYQDKEMTAPVDHLILDDLKQKRRID